MSQIIPGLLWQCGIRDLAAEAQRVQPGAVINMAGRERAFSRQVETYLCWPIEDADLPDLRILQGVVQMVHGLISSGTRTIVHCNAGLNRSGLVVAAVVQRHYGISGHSAVEMLRVRHDPAALCNETFRKYIEALL